MKGLCFSRLSFREPDPKNNPVPSDPVKLQTWTLAWASKGPILKPLSPAVHTFLCHECAIKHVHSTIGGGIAVAGLVSALGLNDMQKVGQPYRSIGQWKGFSGWKEGGREGVKLGRVGKDWAWEGAETANESWILSQARWSTWASLTLNPFKHMHRAKETHGCRLQSPFLQGDLKQYLSAHRIQLSPFWLCSSHGHWAI